MKIKVYIHGSYICSCGKTMQIQPVGAQGQQTLACWNKSCEEYNIKYKHPVVEMTLVKSDT